MACNFSFLIWPDGSAPAALASEPTFRASGTTKQLASDSFSSLIFFLLPFSSLIRPTSAFPSVHIVGSLTSKLSSAISYHCPDNSRTTHPIAWSAERDGCLTEPFAPEPPQIGHMCWSWRCAEFCFGTRTHFDQLMWFHLDEHGYIYIWLCELCVGLFLKCVFERLDLQQLYISFLWL